ncbi:MAG: type II secretion system F family protein [Acidimicrobiia bacterium]|nr:type II secretion system F family protein [Acidimicrobiia bacterium]
MIALAVPLAWGAIVLAGPWKRRPAPQRVRALLDTRHRRQRTRGSALQRVGGAVLRVCRRPDDPLLARRIGGAALLAATVAPVLPMAAPLAALVGWLWPTVRGRREERRRLGALAADLPDVVDLFVLAIGAGLTVPLAVTTVSRRASGPLGAELRRVCDDVGVGRRLADALDDVPARAGEAVRPLVAALVASERYGAPLTAGLARLADEVRRDRRRKAEEAARRIPVKLLFPLVGCTLPAFALLTVAPLIAGAVRSLHF